MSNCATANEFRNLVEKTEFASVEVVEDVRITYRNFREVVETNHRQQSLLAMFSALSPQILFRLLGELPILGSSIKFVVSQFKNKRKEENAGDSNN